MPPPRLESDTESMDMPTRLHPRASGFDSAVEDAADSRLASLTKRQREVLALMAEGHNNRAIARRLVLEEKSVENHINAIFNHLKIARDTAAHRRVKAVLLYLDERADEQAADPRMAA